jgi:hypothetical protein
MTPGQLIEVISAKNRELTKANDDYPTLAEKKADAERSFNIALARKTLQLKAEKIPATLIPALAKGDETVANLKFAADVADEVLKAQKMKCAELASAIDSARSLLTWMRAEMERA